MLLLLACTGPTAHDSGADSTILIDDTAPSDDSSVTDDTGEHPFSCGEANPPVAVSDIPAIQVSGQVNWTLSFDETAESNDFYDCGYARTYEGLQTLDTPWSCADCEVISRGPVTITEGADCVAQISSSGEVRTEKWGWNSDGEFFRATSENARMGMLEGGTPHAFDYQAGTADLMWEGEYELTEDRGTVLISASGTMAFAAGDELIADPFAADREHDYAGSWPRNDPGDLEASWAPTVGETIPNFRLEDQCEDLLDLWDLHGAYTVIEVSQYNCGPCQTMAETAGTWQDHMAGQGVPVQFVTLHGNGLGDSYGTPDHSIIEAWTEEFGNHGPVIADRGWGIAMAYSVIEDYGLSFPAWFIVDPDFKVIHAQTGFSDWDDAEAIILGQ